MGLGQHGAEDAAGGSRGLSLSVTSGGSALTLKVLVRFMAEDAECLSGAKSGGRHDPRSIRIRKLEEEKHVAEMQASTELDMRSKTPELKGATSTTALEEENLLLKEQVRMVSEQLQLLTTSVQECGQLGRELCEKFRWLDDQG